MVILFSFLFFLGIQGEANTNGDSENAVSGWPAHFAGEPLPGLLANVNLQEEKWPIQKWIFGYESCKDPIDQLWRDLDDYEKLIYEQKYEEAKELYDKINHEQRTSGDCSKALWAALLVKSSLLGPRVVKESSESEEESNQENENDFFGDHGEDGELSTTIGLHEGAHPIDPQKIYSDYRYEFSLFVLFLTNKGLIQKLSPHLRHVISGDYPDSLWLQRNDEGYFTVAFYDCYSSNIFVDTDLRPFNLAAILYHELDHLFRESFSGGFNSENLFGNLRNYVEMDELLATLSSGFYQRRLLQVNPNFAINTHDIGNEFNLFQTDGPLDQSFQLVFAEHQGPLAQFPISTGYFAGLSNYQTLNGSHSSVDEILCEMQTRILSGYFTDFSQTDCETQNTLDYREVSLLFQDIHLRQLAYERGLRISEWDPVFEPNEVVKKVEEFFDSFSIGLSIPSQQCKNMMESQSEGLLDDYLGSALSTHGGRNGNGGVRPWLLPSLIGTPGDSEQGVRPSTFGIRACTRTKF